MRTGGGTSTGKAVHRLLPQPATSRPHPSNSVGHAAASCRTPGTSERRGPLLDQEVRSKTLSGRRQIIWRTWDSSFCRESTTAGSSEQRCTVHSPQLHHIKAVRLQHRRRGCRWYACCYCFGKREWFASVQQLGRQRGVGDCRAPARAVRCNPTDPRRRVSNEESVRSFRS